MSVGKTTSDSGEDIVKELARRLNEFSDQDLAANRGGKISDNSVLASWPKKALRPLLTTGSTLVGWLFLLLLPEIILLRGFVAALHYEKKPASA